MLGNNWLNFIFTDDIMKLVTSSRFFHILIFLFLSSARTLVKLFIVGKFVFKTNEYIYSAINTSCTEKVIIELMHEEGMQCTELTIQGYLRVRHSLKYFK